MVNVCFRCCCVRWGAWNFLKILSAWVLGRDFFECRDSFVVIWNAGNFKKVRGSDSSTGIACRRARPLEYEVATSLSWERPSDSLLLSSLFTADNIVRERKNWYYVSSMKIFRMHQKLISIPALDSRNRSRNECAPESGCNNEEVAARSIGFGGIRLTPGSPALRPRLIHRMSRGDNVCWSQTSGRATRYSDNLWMKQMCEPVF